MTQAPFSRAYKNYALAAMTAVYMLNLVDRGLMGLLLQSIKVDLALSDTQLGFVTGIAFGLFYAVLGVPIARWADRGNRVTITSLAIGLWGLTVMGTLLVANYVQLVLARIAAAIGEAGCKPPTYSLVGDYFPGAAERTRAMGIYWIGNPLSALVSLILGGWLNELYGWRMTFFIMGIPGLLLAIVIKLTIVEVRVVKPSAEPLTPMRDVLPMLWRQRAYRHLIIALILLYLLGLGMATWYGAFMIRSHGMGTRELGVWLGLIFCFGGISGIYLGGFACSRWMGTDERAQMRWSAALIACTVPVSAAFLMLPDKHAALGSLFVLQVMMGFFYAPVYALMQRLVRDDIRATALAVVMLLANVIGMGIGPQIVGILSDMLRPQLGSDSLRYAMLSLSFVALVAAHQFWQVGATVKEDLDEADGLRANPQAAR